MRMTAPYCDDRESSSGGGESHMSEREKLPERSPQAGAAASTFG